MRSNAGMNKRGELEIALNKRVIERAVWALIVVVLLLVILLRPSNSPDEGQLEEVSRLETELNASSALLTSLQSQLAESRKEVADLKAKQQAAATQNTTKPTVPTTPAPTLSGKVDYNWTVDAAVQSPLEYNANAIAKLEAQVDTLEAEYDENDTTAGRKNLIEDEIDTLQDEIRDLKAGESKLKLKSVKIRIENGLSQDAAFDYLVCWAAFDCTIIKSTGTMSVSSGKTVEEDVKLDIPTILQLDKAQVLRITITRDGKEVYKDDMSFRA